MDRTRKTAVWLVVAVLALGMVLAISGQAAAHDKWTFVWDQQFPGTVSDLYGVDALDPTHVWAVGTGGAIYFYDGASWTQQGAGATLETLYEVSALDASHVWAVGGHGTVLFFNGSTWSAQASGTTRILYGVFALSANHVWAVGSNGTIRHFNGSAWGEQASGTTETLHSVEAMNAGYAIAVGNNSRLFFNGAGWASTGATTFDSLSVAIYDAAHAWAVGANARISHYTGGTWTDQANPMPAGVTINGITITNNPSMHAWVCGSDGSIVWGSETEYWTDGGDIYWESLQDISAADSTHVWTVGSSGAIFYGHTFEHPTTNRDWGTDSRGMTSAQANWYLAEGSTGPGFVTYVLITNPQAADAAIDVSFMSDDSTVTVPTFNLPAQSRTTLNVADYMPNEWGVATRLHSSVGVVVERSMYASDRTWGHNSIGVTGPNIDWFLAEGSTGPGFETWITVQNAAAVPAHVTLSYMTPDGTTVGPSVTMAPASRETFNVADTLPDEWSVSTMVTSDSPVIAERSMYGNGRTWAHECVGLNTPSANWFLAEGCTGPEFETWIVLQNAGIETAHVTLTYQTAAGPVAGPVVDLFPGTRQSINVGDTVQTWEVSTRVTSDRGIIAERAMYGSSRTWGHDSFGATAPMVNWYLAEGGTSNSVETWFTVQNPTIEPANVTFTFYTPAGEGPTFTVTVPAQTRRTYNAGDYIANYDFGVRAASTRPIILERSMYGGCST